MTKKWTIHNGDVLVWLKTLPDNYFDASFSDTPYGLGPREPTAQEMIDYLLGNEGLDTGGDFMGKEWQIPPVAVLRELYRVLKPGAYILFYSGTRTFDLLMIGLRAAGFKMRDTIAWMYGSGFPKSMNVSKAIDKAAGNERPVIGSRVLTGNAALTTKEKGGTYGVGVGTAPAKTVDVTGPGSEEAADWEGFGTALKPGWEPVIVAMKPLDGTVVHNALTWGTGALNIDAARVGNLGGTTKDRSTADADAGNALGAGLNGGAAVALAAGRWPANVVLSHTESCVCIGTKKVKSSTLLTTHELRESENVAMSGKNYARNPNRDYAPGGTEEIEAWECHESCPVRMLDEQTGDLPIAGSAKNGTPHTPAPGGYGGGWTGAASRVLPTNEGGASRFFYCAKADRAERDFGCEDLPVREAPETVDRDPNSAGAASPRAGAGRRAGIIHYKCSNCGLVVTTQSKDETCHGGAVHAFVVESVQEGVKNFHPTVKPIAANEHFSSLLLVPQRDSSPRRILIPYSGSGSEMIGAMRAGWDEIIGIEIDPEYIVIAEARLTRWSTAQPHLTTGEIVRKDTRDRRQVSLF